MHQTSGRMLWCDSVRVGYLDSQKNKPMAMVDALNTSSVLDLSNMRDGAQPSVSTGLCPTLGDGGNTSVWRETLQGRGDLGT